MTTKVAQKVRAKATKPAFPYMMEALLRGYLGPKLAKDAELDLKPVILAYGLPKKDKAGKITGGNPEAFKVALDAALKGKNGKAVLALDADVADVTELLNTLDDMAPQIADLVVGGDPSAGPLGDVDGGGDDDGSMPPADSSDTVPPPDPAPAPEAGKEPTPPPADTDDSGEAKVMTFLSSKLSPEDLEQVKAMLSGGKDMATDKVTKPAMDAAIEAALEKERVKQRNLRVAEQAVLPIVGPVNKGKVTMDSAEKVYTFALGRIGVKTEGVHPDALPAIVAAHAKIHSNGGSPRPKLGQDAAGPAKPMFSEDLARLKTA